MSAAIGSSVSSSTEPSPASAADGKAAPRAGGEYLAALTRRREAAAIRRQIGYGLVVGWVLTLVCGFFFYCLASRAAWVWGSLMVVGLVHLGLAVVLPQALAWPERIWSAIAQWQGKLVMGLLLTIVYFCLLWPARRLRQAPSEFHSWDEQPKGTATSWQPLPAEEAEDAAVQNRQRSLPVLLAAVVAFFIRRKEYVLLPILILLLILGLALFFVQSSAIAPFIYTLF